MLAAVAVPAYQSYKKDAALAALQADSASITKSILACSTVKTFNDCDTAADVGIDNVKNLGTPVAKAPVVCHQFSREISGLTYKQCVSVNITTGTDSRTNSESSCHEQKAGKTCTGASIGVAADCPQVTPFQACAGDADCSVTTATSNAKCVTGSTGECKSADATCG